MACHIEGAGPPLVLLHGGAGSWTHWVRNIPALAAHYTVYALDLPGCGDSPDVAPDIDPQRYVDRVCEAVREMTSGGRLRLGGFSFGAVVSTMVAARMPQTIDKLALVAPGGLGRVNAAGSSLRKLPPESAGEAARREVLRHNLHVMMLAHADSIDDATIDIQRDNVARTRYDSRRFTGSHLTKESLWRVRAPMIAIFGALDNLSHPSVYARIVPLRSARPDIPIELVPNAGHWVQYEAPAAVNRLLVDFLK
jgi:2-hydroxy-6-oxonona-2,4-dienedioate hydrolase